MLYLQERTTSELRRSIGPTLKERHECATRIDGFVCIFLESRIFLTSELVWVRLACISCSSPGTGMVGSIQNVVDKPPEAQAAVVIFLESVASRWVKLRALRVKAPKIFMVVPSGR